MNKRADKKSSFMQSLILKFTCNKGQNKNSFFMDYKFENKGHHKKDFFISFLMDYKQHNKRHYKLCDFMYF